MPASYNAMQIDSKPIIAPEEDGLLVRGAVKTTAPRKQRRGREYGFPGLSGSGSEDFGLEADEARWDVMLEAETIGQLLQFEALLDNYNWESRYRLVSEADPSGTVFWDNVAYLGYLPLTLERIQVGQYVHYLRTATVRWKWMVPA